MPYRTNIPAVDTGMGMGMSADTPDAVLAALRENNQAPYGRPRTVRAEELVTAAEQFDDKGVLVTALFELMSAYTYSGEERKSPVVFARIVQLWDRTPGDFSDWEKHELYWRFKWVTTALIQVPEVPLAAIERWTAEMRHRYAGAGHGMQPVYAMRHLVARHTGVDTDTAYDLWVTRPRTDLSDCEACETRQQALHHVAAGDDEGALRVWAPVLGGGLTCLEEPHVSMAYALLPLLRAGRTDEARSHHLTGYRFARGKPDMADALGLHLEFCALSGNEGRGLEVLAESRGMFGITGSPLDRLDFLTGAEILLARLAAGDHGGLPVPGPPGRNWTVGALLAHVRDEASALAAAFDARNGTAAVSGRRLARLAQEPLLDRPLALGVRASVPSPVTAAQPQPVAAAEPVPEDFAALVLRARELTAVGRPDADALWDRIRTVADAPGHTHDSALGPQIVLRAELAERRAFDGFDREEWVQARTVMLAAAGLYEEAGLPLRAAAARARAATALVAAGESDPLVDSSVARAELDAELALVAGLELVGEVAVGAGLPDTAGPADPADAAGRADAVGTAAASGPAGAAGPADGADGMDADRYLAILQCDVMVSLHALITALAEPADGVREMAGAGEEDDSREAGTAREGTDARNAPDTQGVAGTPGVPGTSGVPGTPQTDGTPKAPGTAEADAVRAAFERSAGTLLREADRLGSAPRASAARQYAADVAARTGRFDVATEELTAALDLIEAAGQPWRSPRPLALLAQVKVQSGQAEEAVPLIHRALAAAARWPDASLPLGPLYALLGHACAHGGDPAAAVRHLSEAADRLDRDGADEHAAQVRLELADVLAAEGRRADSVAVLESVVLGDTTGLDPRLRAQTQLNLARGLSALGERRAAAEEFLRLAESVADWSEEQYTHTLVACEAAVALAQADQWDAAHRAYRRAVASHGRAPRPAAAVSMMREFARLTMAEREADGLDAALRHLAEADELCARVPEDAPDFVHWYQTGTVHYQRARAYASAHAYEDALAEIERAIAVYDTAGTIGEEPRAEAVRVAALIEGNTLGAVDAATVRLDAAIARCEAAGLPEAAAALAAVRSGLT